jgi:hypothetical protein
LKDPQHVDATKAPTNCEISKIVGAEWSQLDEFKKKQFLIPAEIQLEMR